MGFPPRPYTFISISWFRFGLHHLWYSAFMCLPPFVPRPLVQGDVFARGSVPRKILCHPSPDDRLPAAVIPIGDKRPPTGPHQFPRLVPVELETCPARRVFVRLNHGIRKPPGVPDDRHRSVLETLYLGETTGLILRRHEEDVRPGLDLVRQPVVEPEPAGNLVRMAPGD